MNYYVYILSNVTNTAKYDIHKLVYYEVTCDVRAAIEREKQIKGWNRARKNKLVESRNPRWEDLYDSIVF